MVPTVKKKGHTGSPLKKKTHKISKSNRSSKMNIKGGKLLDFSNEEAPFPLNFEATTNR